MNQRSPVVFITIAFVAACLGYALGQWKGNENALQLNAQIEELQGQVKRGTESLANEDLRIDLTDAYRHATAALLDLVQNQPEQARRHLATTAKLMSNRKDSDSQEIARLAADLANADNLMSKQNDVKSLNSRLDNLVPKPMNSAPSTL